MEFFDSLCDVAATFTASDPEFGLLGAVLCWNYFEAVVYNLGDLMYLSRI
jgi:hypothetical protein